MLFKNPVRASKRTPHFTITKINWLTLFKFNPLKTKLVLMLFKNSVRTSKRTPHFTITKINCLMLFKEIIYVYAENHRKHIDTKYSVAGCQTDGIYSYRSALKGSSPGRKTYNLAGVYC
jgi:hypothetical protein